MKNSYVILRQSFLNTFSSAYLLNLWTEVKNSGIFILLFRKYKKKQEEML